MGRLRWTGTLFDGGQLRCQGVDTSGQGRLTYISQQLSLRVT